MHQNLLASCHNNVAMSLNTLADGIVPEVYSTGWCFHLCTRD